VARDLLLIGLGTVTLAAALAAIAFGLRWFADISERRNAKRLTVSGAMTRCAWLLLPASRSAFSIQMTCADARA
jgi:hypothetical protein